MSGLQLRHAWMDFIIIRHKSSSWQEDASCSRPRLYLKGKGHNLGSWVKKLTRSIPPSLLQLVSPNMACVCGVHLEAVEWRIVLIGQYDLDPYLDIWTQLPIIASLWSMTYALMRIENRTWAFRKVKKHYVNHVGSHPAVTHRLKMLGR